MKSTYSPVTVKVSGAVVISAVVLIGVYKLIFGGDRQPARQVIVSTASTASATPTTSVVAAPPQSAYRDGTYAFTAAYSVPRDGNNSIKATVAIRAGQISSVHISDSYSDDQSSPYISSFESKISSVVVGQKIDQVNVYRLGSASLTSDAFNEVLSKVVAVAKV